MVKYKKKSEFLMIILIGALLSVYFYSQLINTELPIHSDDAATATDLRDMIEMGNFKWIYWISPLGCLNGVLYVLFGPTEFFLQLFFAIKYFFCITVTLYLAVYNKKIRWCLLPFFVFFALPGNFGIASIQPLKFHVWTELVPLICLLYIFHRGNRISFLNKRDILVLAVFSACGLFERDILIIVTCWLPLIVYCFIYLYQKGYITKYIKYFTVAGMLILIVGKAFFSFVQYNGYGASSFVEIETIFSNLFIGIAGFLSMFNIDIIGTNILQFNTIINGIRLLVLFYAMWCVACIMKDIFKKQIENVNMDEAILAISSIVLVSAFLLGGKREDEISIRYMAYSYYIFLILSCRKLFEIIGNKKLQFQLKTCKVNVITCFFVVCISVTVNPIRLSREENIADELAEQILQMDDELKCGMGSFWVADVVSCLTDYSHEVQASEWNANGTILPYMNEWDSYRNGSRNYNFFIEDCNQGNFGINSNNLLKSFGGYRKKTKICNANVYLYDYDIRTVPLSINADDQVYIKNYSDLEIKNQYILMKKGEELQLQNLYVTSGKIRVTISGDFETNAIALKSDEKATIHLTKNMKSLAIYEITAEQLYDNFDLKVTSNTEAINKIRNIRIERLENCILLPVESEYTLDLSSGYYIFGMEGDDVKNSQMEFEMNGKKMDAEKINSGRMKAAYGIQVINGGKLKVSAYYKGRIKSVYYQNQILGMINNPNRTIYTLNHGMLTKKSEGLLYGPYANLEPGEYLIDIYGSKLDCADIRFTYEGGVSFEDFILIRNNPNHYTYRINLEEDLDAFEVLISDIRDTDLEVDYYAITALNTQFVEKVELSYPYNSQDIYTKAEIDDNRKVITLKSGEFCYGPYVNLQSGKYMLSILGDNLSDSEISITIENGEQRIDHLYKILDTGNKLDIQFEVEEISKNLEIIIKNIQKEEIEIERYTIQSIN